MRKLLVVAALAVALPLGVHADHTKPIGGGGAPTPPRVCVVASPFGGCLIWSS